MLKKSVFMLLILFLLLNITGCWDARDIEQLSFPYAAAYDVHQGSSPTSDPREKQVVDVTVLNPNLSPKAMEKASIETVPASLVGYARDKRAYSIPENYFPALNQVLIFGEDIARQGMMNYTDSLLRVPGIAVAMNIAVAEGRGEDILKTPSQDYETMGLQLRAMLRDSQGKGFIPSSTMHQFAVREVPGKNPVVPLIKRTDGNKIIFTGCAIFKKDRMIYKLNDKETRSLVLLSGIKSSGSLPFFLEVEGKNGDRGVVQVKNSRKVKVTRQGDHYDFLIKVHLDGNLVEHIPDTTKIDEVKLRGIEKVVARDIQQDCEQLLGKIQKDIGVDCIDINKYAIAKWRTELKDIIDREDFMQHVTIRCRVDVKIRNSGEVL